MADVAGKGYSAALTMASVCSIVRTLSESESEPLPIVERLNRELVRSSVAGRFVTLTLIRLDLATGELAYVNAGHNPPLLVEPSGSVRRLPAGGPVIGALDDVSWQTGTEALPRGATLLGFTDGLTELRAPDGELLGEDRVAQILKDTRGSPLSVVRMQLLDCAKKFLKGGTPNDDLTVLAARRL